MAGVGLHVQSREGAIDSASLAVNVDRHDDGGLGSYRLGVSDEAHPSPFTSLTMHRCPRHTYGRAANVSLVVRANTMRAPGEVLSTWPRGLDAMIIQRLLCARSAARCAKVMEPVFDMHAADSPVPGAAFCPCMVIGSSLMHAAAATTKLFKAADV